MLRRLITSQNTSRLTRSASPINSSSSIIKRKLTDGSKHRPSDHSSLHSLKDTAEDIQHIKQLVSLVAKEVLQPELNRLAKSSESEKLPGKIEIDLKKLSSTFEAKLDRQTSALIAKLDTQSADNKFEFQRLADRIDQLDVSRSALTKAMHESFQLQTVFIFTTVLGALGLAIGLARLGVFSPRQEMPTLLSAQEEESTLQPMPRPK